jgi:hypothetical protein
LFRWEAGIQGLQEQKRGTIENADNAAALLINFRREILLWIMARLGKIDLSIKHNIFQGDQSQKYSKMFVDTVQIKSEHRVPGY